MKVITTPDHVALDREQISKIIRESVGKATGRVPKVCSINWDDGSATVTLEPVPTPTTIPNRPDPD